MTPLLGIADYGGAMKEGHICIRALVRCLVVGLANTRNDDPIWDIRAHHGAVTQCCIR